MENLDAYKDLAVRIIMLYLPKVLLAVATLVIGLILIRILVRIIERALERAQVEIALRHFFKSATDVLFKVLLLISVATILGIQTTSFVALLGAAGLAVGLALQGSLSNFAGGVLILLFKPIRIGDFIEAQGHMGTVHAIMVFNTVLKTPDNKKIIIPNGALSNGSIVNFSAEETRRVDMVFGIGYDDDLKKAKALLNELVEKDPRILKDPAPQVVVGALADSSVNFNCRVWCNKADYWGIFFDMQENVKLEFDAAGISIPYPQTDVHLYQEKSAS